MASEIGVNGGAGLCHLLWLDITKCMSKAEFPIDCKHYREDYLECLHLFKDFSRLKRVQEEAARKAKEAKAAEKAGVVAALACILTWDTLRMSELS